MKKLFDKIEKSTKILYYIYLFLYIFIMVNREFLFFGIDLRFALFPIGLFLITYGLYNRKFNKNSKEEYFDKEFKLIFLLFIWFFISNISWLWNGIEINKTKFINEILLLVNNFIGIIVFFLYKKYFKKDLLRRMLVFSCLILVVSFVLLGLGFDMTQISGSDELCIYRASELAPDHINVFGGRFRLGGYAQDPNYASFLLVIAIITAMQLDAKKTYRAIIAIIFLVALCFSASKTTILASIAGGIYICIVKFVNPKVKRIIDILVLIGIVCMILITLNLFEIRTAFPSTITSRLLMWGEAGKLFENSPLIGNGITSFRSYFAINNWYVQSHSTYMQLLSETGLIGLGIFFRIIYNNLSKKNLYNNFLMIVYLVFSINFETIALQFFVYIIYLMHMENKVVPKGKKALFMVNTLSNGGAERVCINMANELLKQGYKVDFILLNRNNETTYTIDPKANIYDLNIDETNKLKKILKVLTCKSKLDNLILENERDERYSLITSHLPVSNILTRFSIIRNRAIYVFHTTLKFYNNNNFLFKKLLKYIFNNKKVVTVSKGVEEECINDYNMKYCDITTIYNPIDIEKINKYKDEEIELKKPYFLQVGRFSREKQQDRMIDIFYKGEFYRDYQLVFCGTGETEDIIKQKVQSLGIAENVTFLGWQDNTYKWMKNCELLVCTSDTEAFPMILIEAIVCDTKIISSDCKFGPNEILLDEYADFLVKPDEIEEYIEKINIALKEYPNSKNPIIQQCDSKNVIEEYINFMKK